MRIFAISIIFSLLLSCQQTTQAPVDKEKLGKIEEEIQSIRERIVQVETKLDSLIAALAEKEKVKQGVKPTPPPTRPPAKKRI